LGKAEEMRVEEAAEAVLMAFLAVKKHLREELSLKAGLYEATKAYKPRVSALRLARKILHVYAIREAAAYPVLDEVLQGGDVGEDARVLLEILVSAIGSGIELGEPEKLAIALRNIMKKLWPRDVEPWLGIIRALTKGELEIPPLESYPKWFVKMLYRILSKSDAHELMKFQNENRPKTYVALNTLLASEQEILEEADKAGVELIPDKRLQGIYVLRKAADTRKFVRLVKRGLLLVQDFSSYYAVLAADPKPEAKILDVCAAPGTKTILMGIHMRNRGVIVSIDSSAERLRTHLRRVRKAGLKIVEDVVADATARFPMIVKADLVLLDPPCSSTGLFWKEPVYRWTVKPRHVKMFAKLQEKMLERCAEHVKEGGFLVYSTCSVSLEENEILLEDFLKRHPGFELSEIHPKLGSDGLRGLAEARRLYPHRDLCNGFFIAKLRKKW